MSSSGPKLYSGLEWEITQSKTLLFTSGKRRIEQEGIYLESALVPDFPQAFIDYYTQNLQDLGFKETLNSSEPAGITITQTIISKAANDGIKSVLFPTGETAIQFYKEAKESPCWIDFDGKRKVTPQYIELVRVKLSVDLLYSILVNNIGAAYREKNNRDEAKKWYKESIAFIPMGVDYPDPKYALAELEK